MILRSSETEAMTQDVIDSVASGNTEVFSDWLSGLWPAIIGFGIRVLLVIIVFLIGRKLIKLILKLADKSFERLGVEITLRKFLRYFLNFISYCLLIMVLIVVAGKDAASFAAVFSSAWVAVGLSLQGSLSNFAGGILIMLFKPFKVGDYIIECADNQEGVVQSIGLVYTEIATADNKRLVVPNGTLANNSIINVTAMGKRRVEVKVGISYTADLQKAKEVATEVLAANELLLDDEDRIVYVAELAASSVTLGLRGWATSDDYCNALWAINEQVKLAFDEAGIEIPFNQLDVHLK